MRNFFKLDGSVNVAPIEQALLRNADLWDANTFRTTFPGTPHVDVQDILIRFSDTKVQSTVGNVIGDDQPIWLPPYKLLPEVKPVVLELMNAVGAYELGRLIISRIPPGGRILPHADNDGSYVQNPNRSRYHIVIRGLPGSLYHCGEETVCMETGSVWWFNAYETHSVLNNSIDDRIHLLVDVTTWPK